MSPHAVVTPATAPDPRRMRQTADAQMQSDFFGRLPLEIRDMIYAACWEASGPRQHVFLRQGLLAHSPCALAADGETDARLEELRRMFYAQESPRRARTRSFALDEVWAARFASPWLEHWRCEEVMKGVTVDDDGGACSGRTLFLPVLLACKRTYLEARHSLYASTTFIFTDLPTSHAFLALPPSTTSHLHSLSYSLSLPLETLLQHRLRPTPASPAGPWADLCTKLSDLVRFGALRDVTIRLGLLSLPLPPPPDDDNNDNPSHPDADARAWWQVRERWALSAVRGMMARRLVVQLPRAETARRCPGWARVYNYPDDMDNDDDDDAGGGGGGGGGDGDGNDNTGDGNGNGNRGVPFRRLERYAALPPMRFCEDRRVETHMDAPCSGSSSALCSVGSVSGVSVGGKAKKDRGGTVLRRVRKGVKEWVGG
ncbi:hypothetical protein M426DRAFT_12169 [Hypoxylon sp. CI-4A]|nr:hypothetical protein M426DRAFT_12169 [Hypoxylon sp. CI-4A]